MASQLWNSTWSGVAWNAKTKRPHSWPRMRYFFLDPRFLTFLNPRSFTAHDADVLPLTNIYIAVLSISVGSRKHGQCTVVKRRILAPPLRRTLAGRIGANLIRRFS